MVCTISSPPSECSLWWDDEILTLMSNNRRWYRKSERRRKNMSRIRRSNGVVAVLPIVLSSFIALLTAQDYSCAAFSIHPAQHRHAMTGGGTSTMGGRAAAFGSMINVFVQNTNVPLSGSTHYTYIGTAVPALSTTELASSRIGRTSGAGSGGGGGRTQNNKALQSSTVPHSTRSTDSSDADGGTTNNSNNTNGNNHNKKHRHNNHNHNHNNKRPRKRRTKSPSEKARDELRRSRQARYEQIVDSNRNFRNGNSTDDHAEQPSLLFSFEALFPDPVWDEKSVYKDLFETRERDQNKRRQRRQQERRAPLYRNDTDHNSQPFLVLGSDAATVDRRVGSSTTAVRPKTGSRLPYDPPQQKDERRNKVASVDNNKSGNLPKTASKKSVGKPKLMINSNATSTNTTSDSSNATSVVVVDRTLTRMVEDRVYGMMRSTQGDLYDAGDDKRTSDKGAPLQVNTDRLSYFAKRELSRGRLEEARELYLRCVDVDPRDGRGYLGLSRVATMRKDVVAAREVLRQGLRHSVDPETGGVNPFLLQALGCLEEKAGHLTEAERLYAQAARERPWHAAAWVALAQLRTKRLRKGAQAGRVCYQTAERELRNAGKRPSSHVYTAWASLEYKKAGDVRRARELFEKAIEIDPRCSAAFAQLGVMEADRENYDRAKGCFEEVLQFDPRNSRVLQAYAIMESKRPGGDSRDAIDLFERALRANARDAGVLQAYGLYVSRLGDVDAARDLLHRATKVDRRHAPAWQAWGVLETRYGNPEDARDVFQQGIWACAQSGGGQSGGRHCARLWQAWGVLESRQGEHAAARRCFSRALDADVRNVAALTAWTSMEGELGNVEDARYIFERALKKFSGGSDDKMVLWGAYELMEIKAGHPDEAQMVYQRSMRETMSRVQDDSSSNVDAVPDVPDYDNRTRQKKRQPPPIEEVLKHGEEQVEVVRWRSKREFGRGEVWMNNGSIEGKVPSSKMKKNKMAASVGGSGKKPPRRNGATD